VIDRFGLYVVIRAQVSDRALRRRYLAIEAIMETLAPSASLDPAMAGLTGLGACIDAQLCRHNDERRGELAEELLLTEGVPAEVATAVRQCYRVDDVERLSPLAALLVAAEGIAESVYEQLELGPLDAAQPGAPASRRAFECLQRLDVDAREASSAGLAAMIRIRGDLKL
jgi:hypothetical protein